MLRVFLIGLGGYAGSVARYWLSGLIQQIMPGSVFPLGTLAVNVIGCVALGVLSELAETAGFPSPEARAFLVIGLLGGFTTFSAFANETMVAIRAGSYAVGVANIMLNVFACLAAVWAGRSAIHLLWRS